MVACKKQFKRLLHDRRDLGVGPRIADRLRLLRRRWTAWRRRVARLRPAGREERGTPRQFDQAARPLLSGYLADDAIELVYRPIAILDRATTTEFSTRAASAAGCAADEGRIDGFVAVMMANQPAEGSEGLSDQQIVQLAASAGLSGEAFEQCVADGTYADWAGENTNAAADRGVQGTPTVYVDGQELPALSLEALVTAIENADR